MNTKIALSTLSILAALGLMGGAAFAFFNDSGTSSNNTFGAGTLDMTLSKDNITFSDSDSSTVASSNMSPGATFSRDLYIKNTGSTSGNHIDLDFTNAVLEALSPPGNGTTPNFASVLEVTALGWDLDGNGSTDTNILPSVLDCDSNGNAICDLQDLENLSVVPFGDRVNLTFGGVQSSPHLLHIEGRLHPTKAINTNQGDSDNLTIGVFMDGGAH